MSEDVKEAIRDMVDQLEKYNWAISSNGNAVRFFSRFTPDNYKRDKTIRFYKSINGGESFIWLDNEYEIKKFPNHNFLIKQKGEKVGKNIENFDL